MGVVEKNWLGWEVDWLEVWSNKDVSVFVFVFVFVFNFFFFFLGGGGGFFV